MEPEEAEKQIDHGHWWPASDDPHSVIVGLLDCGYTYVTESSQYVKHKIYRHTWYFTIDAKNKTKLVDWAPKFTKVEFDYEVQRVSEKDSDRDGDSEVVQRWA